MELGSFVRCKLVAFFLNKTRSREQTSGLVPVACVSSITDVLWHLFYVLFIFVSFCIVCV
jgi:hypothetical protein